MDALDWFAIFVMGVLVSRGALAFVVDYLAWRESIGG